MTSLSMPPGRNFGWELKPIESARFAIHERSNGQLCVVLNHALLRGVSPEFFEAWQTHNPIEVGTFENFLPHLFSQRDQRDTLSYDRSSNSASSAEQQTSFDPALFAERFEGFKEATNPHDYLGYMNPSFLTQC